MAKPSITIGWFPRERFIVAAEPLQTLLEKNFILDRVTTDYVALVENDVLFTPGWLEWLWSACEEEPADVAPPEIYDERGYKNHFDKHLGEIQFDESQPGNRRIVPLQRERKSACCVSSK